MKNNKSDGKCDGEEAAAALDRPAAVTHIGLMRQRQAGGSVIVVFAICKSNDKQRQQEGQATNAMPAGYGSQDIVLSIYILLEVGRD